jgi:hypothetical protein
MDPQDQTRYHEGYEVPRWGRVLSVIITIIASGILGALFSVFYPLAASANSDLSL